MKHLTTILHVGDDTINDHQRLGVDHITANAPNLHVAACSGETASLVREYIGAQLILYLGGDVCCVGELKVGGSSHIHDVVILIVECRCSIIVKNDIAQLPTLVQTYANRVVTWKRDVHGRAVERHFHREIAILVGERGITIANHRLHKHTSQRSMTLLTNHVALDFTCGLLLLRCLANMPHDSRVCILCA